MSVFEMDGQTPVIYAGDEWRKLTSIPTPPTLIATFRSIKEAAPTIPRDKWRPVSRPRTTIPVLDQGQLGSCVGHGSTTAIMLDRDIGGQTFQMLSPCFVYSQINNGRDQGAIPGDAAKVLMNMGVCLMSEVPSNIWQKGKIPQSAYETAKRFKAREVFSCKNFDEVVSAFLLGFSVFDTIMVGNNFNNLDTDGCPPLARGPGNHCIVVGSVLKLSRNGKWLLQRINSWRNSWGDDGCYFQSEEHCLAQGQYYEAWAVKDVFDDPQDVASLPPASTELIA